MDIKQIYIENCEGFDEYMPDGSCRNGLRMTLEGFKNAITKVSQVDLQVKQVDNYYVWYEPCEKCGYDTGKSILPDPRDGNKRCCRCGNQIKRDYSDRALKS